MSQIVNVPLESYLLAQQSSPLDCAVCWRQNGMSAEHCVRCGAPLAIARNARDASSRPKLIAVIGAAGVGKTVYLGMLMDMLTRDAGGLPTTVRGPHSIALQQQTATALASGYYPDATPIDPLEWNWVHCAVRPQRRRRTVELVFADAAGDAWAAEAAHPGAYPALSALVSRAAAVMVLIDAHKLHGGAHNHGFIAQRVLPQLNDLYLCGKEPSRAARAASKIRARRRPLAIVLTKTDACREGIVSPELFVASHAGGLLADCRRRLPNTRVFATRAVGASTVRDAQNGRRGVPLRVEPEGVIEPFAWLVSQL